MPKILVVDDEADVLLLVDMILTMQDVDVRTAQDAATAEVELREWRPDVLLLDVTMPDQDGPMLLGQWRARGLAPPQVYLLSAIPPTMLAEIAEGIDVGHIGKPFTAASLREALAEHLAS